MTLKTKYIIFAIISTIFAPLFFILINNIAFFIYKKIFSENVNNFEKKIIIFDNYFLLLLMIVVTILYGANFIKKISINIINIKNTVQTLTYKDNLPHHLKTNSGISSEFNALALSINNLIDRLRYKELTLKKYNSQQENYLKQLSHDINTPLTSLKLEIFQISKEYSINEKNVNDLYKKIDYISTLTSQIKPEQINKINDFYVFKQKINIVPLVENTIQKWQYLFSKKNIKININILHNEVFWIGEELWFERLFDNIISNIYHHSKTPSVNIYLSQQIIIEEFGIGYNVNELTKKGSGLSIISEISQLFSIKTDINSNSNGTIYKLIQQNNNF